MLKSFLHIQINSTNISFQDLHTKKQNIIILTEKWYCRLLPAMITLVSFHSCVANQVMSQVMDTVKLHCSSGRQTNVQATWMTHPMNDLMVGKSNSSLHPVDSEWPSEIIPSKEDKVMHRLHKEKQS